jgi:hypothetical protein
MFERGDEYRHLLVSFDPSELPFRTSGPPTKGPPATVYRYIPSGRFWTLQAVEASMFLLLTIALVGICIAVVVRSRPR